MGMRVGGVTAALLSASLFGASAPLSKLLVAVDDPWLVAGLLYVGSGLGLSFYRLIRGDRGQPIGRADLPWLASGFFFGGVAAPLLLMAGLAGSAGSTASLLLNAEAVFTALIAWAVFKENLGRRVALGMAAIVLGAVLLSWSDATGDIVQWPALCVIGACLSWGIDNNLTRKVALANPIQIAAWKGLIAGATNCAIALSLGAHLPSVGSAAGAMAVGFLAYGVSVSLFIVGLRDLGTARTGAYFSAAPFIGAALSLILFREPATLQFLSAGGLMALGLWLNLTERHEHDHMHEPLAHAHEHEHDAHHDHGHDEPVDGPHTHWHEHRPVRHAHPHYPDAHHRHVH
jgi:drug/metabolite transporter (DMT)-like permease